ncbi:MAG: S41 family peptidase [Acidobacteriota bacterium]
MSSRARAVVFFISTPLVVLVLVGGLVGATRAPQQGVSHLKVFEDVAGLIFAAYVEPADPDKVMDGAMRGLAEGLDPASAYLTPDEVKVADAKTPLPAGDIGVIVTRQFYLRILGVRDGSPAQRAGLATGDFIRAIGETPTRDMSAYTGAHLLRGAPGSKVSLLVIRGNTADPRPFEIVREISKDDRATGKKLPDGNAYVRVSSFGSGAAEAIRSSITALGAATTSGVIVDLRGIADGTAEDAIAAARLFVKGGGTLAIRAGRGPTDRTVTTATDADGKLSMPIVLIVSDGTANAAEIFASALSRNKRATLVGEPTAGLAALQRLVRLPEGGLWMTYARYLQADGTPILEKGLRPDVSVDIAVNDFDEPPVTTDAALARAVEALTPKPAPTADGPIAPATDPTAPTIKK